MENTLWWQTGIIYEVYVRSFQDSNGDGIGDIRGIINRLDYLQWLGITAVWMTPVYPSPMKDFGYDISDYTGIHPLFGTMNDFHELLSEIHKRGMKLVIDFVPNHSSDQHPWFKESSSSTTNPKRNWYYWKDAKSKGLPPNNWLSVLGGSAWEWDERTNQYYYHAFLKEQPDLNLTNPEVVRAVLEAMKFWLDKGVDGFRIDVLWHLVKDEKWRDNPANPDFKPEMPDCDKLLQIFSCDQPEVMDVIHSLRNLVDQYSDKVLLGELYLPTNRVVHYYGVDNKGVQLPGNFQLLFLPWEAQKIGIAIDEYESVLPREGWPNWVIGNHDRPRLIDRIGEAQAKVAAMLLLTLRGTPIMYYGDEIGMRNVPIPKDEWQDPQGLLMPGKNLSRDPQRTPMQWDDTANAGFTKGKPWLRIDKDFKEVNIAVQQKDPESLLSFFRKLIDTRQSSYSLINGDYYPVVNDGEILAYIRKCEGHLSFLVALNLTGKSKSFKPADESLEGKVILSTINNSKKEVFRKTMEMSANEGVLVELSSG